MFIIKDAVLVSYEMFTKIKSKRMGVKPPGYKNFRWVPIEPCVEVSGRNIYIFCRGKYVGCYELTARQYAQI